MHSPPAINPGRLIFRGLSILTLGSILGQLLRFVRNVIVARVLTPEDFGVAATFWITTGFLMSLSELGIEKILVQDDQGDEDHFGAVAQLVILLRGVVTALVIFLFAEPIANLFEAPEALGGFRLLAVIPLINCLQHRDMIRLQRHLSFGPFMLSKIVPDVAITIFAVPIAHACGDYTAFLYISILYGVVSVVSSHLLAERKFMFRWDTAVFLRIFRFGFPLLLNSLLIFAMMQGDRVILAKAYTKAELGVYSVAFSLAMVIPTLAGNVVGQVILPFMAAFKNNRPRFIEELDTFFWPVSLFATLFASSAIIAGPFFIILIYSSKYQLAGTVVGWIAVMHSIRLLRQVPTLASISIGDTLNPLIANLFRQTGLLFALIVALKGFSMEMIAMSGVLGEIFATAAILIVIRYRLAIPITIWIKPLMLFSAIVSVTYLINIRIGPGVQLALLAIELVGLTTATLGLFICFKVPLSRRILQMIMQQASSLFRRRM